MPSPRFPRPPVTPEALQRRARIIRELRLLTARKVPIAPLALLARLAGGPDLSLRTATLASLSQRAVTAGHLSKRDAEALVGLEEVLLAELGFDPRTTRDPLLYGREPVPAEVSVRASLLAGDSAAFLHTVQVAIAAGLPWAATPPEA